MTKMQLEINNLVIYGTFCFTIYSLVSSHVMYHNLSTFISIPMNAHAHLKICWGNGQMMLPPN